jgi:hypothetical protein
MAERAAALVDEVLPRVPVRQRFPGEAGPGRTPAAPAEVALVVPMRSSKDRLCKTYEGELAIFIVPGVTPVIWNFSVRDKSISLQINAALGKRVVLHYREHRGLPRTCFGETSYFVTGVRAVD